jgi:hypothetical protein
MHFCIHELLALSLIVNAINGGSFIWLWKQVTSARALAQKYLNEVKARPVKTIIYGNNHESP